MSTCFFFNPEQLLNCHGYGKGKGKLVAPWAKERWPERRYSGWQTGYAAF